MTVLKKFNRKYPRGEEKLRLLKNYFREGFEFPLKAIPENVICWCSERNPDTPPQMHSRFSLGIVLRGQILYNVEGIPFQLETDHAILVFPTQSHNRMKEGTSSKPLAFHITFTFPKQADVENLLPLKNCIHKLDANMINCVVKIMEQVYNESDNRNFSLIPLLLAQLLNMLLASRKNLPENLRSENLLVQKTLRYIRDNYLDQNICLKNIAHAVGVSPSYLAAVFRREMQGLSIGNYIAKLKFYRSMELLNTTNMNMAEIAKKCGYSNQFAFSRRFRQLNRDQFSPSKYRAESRKSHPLLR